MKLYQGGPMRDYDVYNYNAFELGEKYLSIVLGHEVFSPHQFDIDSGLVTVEYDIKHLSYNGAYIPYRRFTSVELVDEGSNMDEAFAEFIRMDIACIAQDVDAVSFLPGWVFSTGSKIEAQVAKWCKRPIYEHSPFQFFNEAPHAVVNAVTLAAA